MKTLHTVVLPVAGLGTRMLPATKSIPKELLAVFDTPVIQFALDEAVAAGAKRIVLVSHRSKTALEAYFDPKLDLRKALAQKDKTELLDALAKTRVPAGVEIIFTYQDEQRGLGHAVACARKHVVGDAFGVILPDDVILGKPSLSEMFAAYDTALRGSMIAAMEVAKDQVSRYGIFSVEGDRSQAMKATGIVEKPDPADAPSNLAAIGRYILPTDIFDILDRTGPGAGGEIQLTDAIDQKGNIVAFRITGKRFDCGTKEGLFEATCAVRDMRHGAAEEEPIQLAAE